MLHKITKRLEIYIDINLKIFLKRSKQGGRLLGNREYMDSL